jgi:uncharacterized protein
VGLAVALGLVTSLAGCGSCSGARAPEDAAAAADDPPPEIRAKLDTALRARGPGYVPRTRHTNADGSPRYTNRLILESSPYLLQHAHNPVDWFHWGDEAFVRARATGRPVFLSIGYSTCHWCHVMEEESFEDEEIASYLNLHYVAIKVDREERPDVDEVYMTAVQALTGSGGWPMSLWLTPEREPFLGATYLPPRDGVRGARRGFLSILGEQAARFRDDPAGVVADARRLSDEVRRDLSPRPAGELTGPGLVARAAALAAQRYDATWGGVRGAPKFPSSLPIRLLLRHHLRTGDEGSKRMVIETLRHMAAGGIHDQLGGGFHRYATDARWLVPHFEKMLYDNALLAVDYLEAWQATGEDDLARVARETLDDVLRDMTSPEGGFYSATDADSPAPSGRREEGWFFTWTPAEIEAAVGGARARAVEAWFAVTPGGNLDGRTILSTPRPRDEVAQGLGMQRAELDATLDAAIPILREARAKRPPPFRDEKVQASWNGLMISALSRGAFALNEPRYEAAAVRAAELVLHARGPGGELRHAWTAGRPGTDAFLDDHAFVAAGLLDLFEVTGDARWLREAVGLVDALEQRYADPVNGGYFLTAGGAAPGAATAPFPRSKPDVDGAVPSGNAVALMDQLRLAELTTDDRFRQRAETTLRAFAAALDERPLSLGEMMLGVELATGEPREIAVVLPDGAAWGSAEPLLAVLRRAFTPDRVMVIAGESDLAGDLGKLVPWARGKPARGGKPTAYVCRRGACDLPTGDPATLAAQIGRR